VSLNWHELVSENAVIPNEAQRSEESLLARTTTPCTAHHNIPRAVILRLPEQAGAARDLSSFSNRKELFF
jgi:hypothetical protein